MLFLTTDVEDYLADGLLHGLRALLGADVVDYPKAERLYVSATPAQLARVRGRAFTLYGLLDDVAIDRSHVFARMAAGEFDLVVFSRIWSQFGLFAELLPRLGRTAVAVLDGEDSPAPYPYAGRWWREPSLWSVPRAHARFPYFKREWTPETLRHRLFKLVPASVASALPLMRNLRRTSFSIPEEKITRVLAPRARRFPKHVVDAELAARIPGASERYAFASEAAYYEDLQQAQFGVTTRRAGWDCLRHYELAANGCVPLFRDLAKKPATCAPHGLVPGLNCLSYSSADEALELTSRVTAAEYERLQRGALEWARANSTVVRAREFLAELGLSTGEPALRAPAAAEAAR
ncbi:MAG: hypothetical protein ACK4N5_08085 [Myxococcales bacterium]